MNTSPNQHRLGIKEALLAIAIAVCTIASTAAVALAMSAWTEITTEMFSRGTFLVGNPPWWAVITALTIIGAEAVVLTARFWRYLVACHYLAAVPAWVQPTFGVLLLIALAYLGFQVFETHRSALLIEGFSVCVLLIATSSLFARRRQTHGQVAA